MPCTVDMPYDPENDPYNKVVKKLDEVTILLCKVLNDPSTMKDADVVAWKKEHAAVDKARIARELKAKLDQAAKTEKKIKEAQKELDMLNKDIEKAQKSVKRAKNA